MIELTSWLRDELVRRADQEAPLECCGLISRAPEVDPLRPGHIALWGAENAAQEPETSFFITARAQFGLLRQIHKRGEVLAGVYHSHPRSDPEPSERDRAIAYPWSQIPNVELTWVIIGLCEGEDDQHEGPYDCRRCVEGWRFWSGQLP